MVQTSAKGKGIRPVTTNAPADYWRNMPGIISSVAVFVSSRGREVNQLPLPGAQSVPDTGNLCDYGGDGLAGTCFLRGEGNRDAANEYPPAGGHSPCPSPGFRAEISFRQFIMTTTIGALPLQEVVSLCVSWYTPRPCNRRDGRLQAKCPDRETGRIAS